MDLCEVEELTPLKCCSASGFVGKKGTNSFERAVKLVEEFSQFVGISCDGFKRKLSELFAHILLSIMK